jgi:lipoprotein-releasing system permease protein
VNRTLAEARRNPQVTGAAPFVSAQALLARGEDMKGVLVRGIDPALEPEVTDLAGVLKDTAVAPGAGRIRHRAGRRAGARAGRARGRCGDADRAQRPGHAGRRGAAPEADDRGGHL